MHPAAAASGAVRRGIVAWLIWSIGAAAFAQQYSIVDLGTLGGSASMAYGINCDGMAVGYARTSSGAKHAVRWDGGAITDLGVPEGFPASEAVAINRLGQVAGDALDSPQALQAHVWQSGVWIALGVLPGRAESSAAAIDSFGRVAGTSFTLGAGDSRAFLWDEGYLRDLGSLGGDSSAEGMNDRGQVVGSSRTGGSGSPRHAFVWQNGSMADLGTLPGEDHSRAIDINGQGDAVGSSWHVTGTQMLMVERATLWRQDGAEIVDLGATPGPDVCIVGEPFYTVNVAQALTDCGEIVGHARCVGSGAALAAFVWRDGVMSNLNDLVPDGSGWDLRDAVDVNDRGQIVGVGIAPDGQPHGFLLLPDEPPPCPLTLRIGPGGAAWNPQPDVVGYDVVSGDLEILRSTSGDFAEATTACVADDTQTTMVGGLASPQPGRGLWLLVRSIGASGPGTYDGGPAQVAPRDPGIDASGVACP